MPFFIVHAHKTHWLLGRYDIKLYDDLQKIQKQRDAHDEFNDPDQMFVIDKNKTFHWVNHRFPRIFLGCHRMHMLDQQKKPMFSNLDHLSDRTNADDRQETHDMKKKHRVENHLSHVHSHTKSLETHPLRTKNNCCSDRDLKTSITSLEDQENKRWFNQQFKTVLEKIIAQSDDIASDYAQLAKCFCSATFETNLLHFRDIKDYYVFHFPIYSYKIRDEFNKLWIKKMNKQGVVDLSDWSANKKQAISVAGNKRLSKKSTTSTFYRDQFSKHAPDNVEHEFDKISYHHATLDMPLQMYPTIQCSHLPDLQYRTRKRIEQGQYYITLYDYILFVLNCYPYGTYFDNLCDRVFELKHMEQIKSSSKKSETKNEYAKSAIMRQTSDYKKIKKEIRNKLTNAVHDKTQKNDIFVFQDHPYRMHWYILKCYIIPSQINTIVYYVRRYTKKFPQSLNIKEDNTNDRQVREKIDWLIIKHRMWFDWLSRQILLFHLLIKQWIKSDKNMICFDDWYHPTSTEWFNQHMMLTERSRHDGHDTRSKHHDHSNKKQTDSNSTSRHTWSFKIHMHTLIDLLSDRGVELEWFWNYFDVSQKIKIYEMVFTGRTTKIPIKVQVLKKWLQLWIHQCLNSIENNPCPPPYFNHQLIANIDGKYYNDDDMIDYNRKCTKKNGSDHKCHTLKKNNQSCIKYDTNCDKTIQINETENDNDDHEGDMILTRSCVNSSLTCSKNGRTNTKKNTSMHGAYNVRRKRDILDGDGNNRDNNNNNGEDDVSISNDSESSSKRSGSESSESSKDNTSLSPSSSSLSSGPLHTIRNGKKMNTNNASHINRRSSSSHDKHNQNLVTDRKHQEITQAPTIKKNNQRELKIKGDRRVSDKPTMPAQRFSVISKKKNNHHLAPSSLHTPTTHHSPSLADNNMSRHYKQHDHSKFKHIVSSVSTDNSSHHSYSDSPLNSLNELSGDPDEFKTLKKQSRYNSKLNNGHRVVASAQNSRSYRVDKKNANDDTHDRYYKSADETRSDRNKKINIIQANSMDSDVQSDQHSIPSDSIDQNDVIKRGKDNLTSSYRHRRDDVSYYPGTDGRRAHLQSKRDHSSYKHRDPETLTPKHHRTSMTSSSRVPRASSPPLIPQPYINGYENDDQFKKSRQYYDRTQNQPLTSNAGMSTSHAGNPPVYPSEILKHQNATYDFDQSDSYQDNDLHAYPNTHRHKVSQRGYTNPYRNENNTNHTFDRTVRPNISSKSRHTPEMEMTSRSPPSVDEQDSKRNSRRKKNVGDHFSNQRQRSINDSDSTSIQNDIYDGVYHKSPVRTSSEQHRRDNSYDSMNAHVLVQKSDNSYHHKHYSSDHLHPSDHTSSVEVIHNTPKELTQKNTSYDNTVDKMPRNMIPVTHNMEQHMMQWLRKPPSKINYPNQSSYALKWCNFFKACSKEDQSACLSYQILFYKQFFKRFANVVQDYYDHFIHDLDSQTHVFANQTSNLIISEQEKYKRESRTDEQLYSLVYNYHEKHLKKQIYKLIFYQYMNNYVQNANRMLKALKVDMDWMDMIQTSNNVSLILGYNFSDFKNDIVTHFCKSPEDWLEFVENLHTTANRWIDRYYPIFSNYLKEKYKKTVQQIFSQYFELFDDSVLKDESITPQQLHKALLSFFNTQWITLFKERKNIPMFEKILIIIDAHLKFYDLADEIWMELWHIPLTD